MAVEDLLLVKMRAILCCFLENEMKSREMCFPGFALYFEGIYIRGDGILLHFCKGDGGGL
jgi:hypothetical protein